MSQDEGGSAETVPSAVGHTRPVGDAAGRSERGRIAVGGLWNASAWFVSTGIGAALTIVLVRVMAPAQYGDFAIALAGTSLLSAVAGLGLNLAVAQVASAERVEKGDTGLRATLDVSFRIALISAGATTLVAVVLALVASDLVPSVRPERAAFLAMVPIITVTPLAAVYSGFLRVTFKPRVIVASAVGSSVLQAALVAGAILAGLKSAAEIAGTRTVANLAATAVLAVAVRRWRVGAPAAAATRTLWRRVLGFSGAMLLTGVFTTMVSQLDVFILGVDRGNRPTALYQPLSRLTDLLLGLPVLLGNYFLPAVSAAAARSDDAEVRRLYHWASRWNLVVCAPALGVVLVCAAPVLRILFGRSYGTVAGSLQVLALGAIVQVVFGFNGLALDGYGLARLVAIRQTIALVVSAVACVTLIPVLGILGAAAATSVAMAVSNLMCSGVLLVRFRVRPWDRALAITAAGFALAIGASFALEDALRSDWWRSVVTVVVVGTVTLASSLAAGGKRERRAILRQYSKLAGRGLQS